MMALANPGSQNYLTHVPFQTDGNKGGNTPSHVHAPHFEPHLTLGGYWAVKVTYLPGRLL